MDSKLEYSASDYLNALRRRRRVLAMVAIPVLIVAALLSSFLPDKYTSSAQIDINLEGTSADTLEPIEVSSYADQYLAKLTDRALAHENLLKLANDPEIFGAGMDSLSEPERLDKVSESIDVAVTTQVVLSPITGREVDMISGFRIAAEGPDPDFVFNVAKNAVKLFVAADRESRTERASSASLFLSDQMNSTEKEIVDLEQQIADFKVVNACCLPELVSLNTSVIERTEREITDIRPRIRALEQDRTFLQNELVEIRKLTATTDHVEELERQYAALVANYGPDHPDVIRLRREISAITSANNGNSTDYEAVDLRMRLVEAEQRYSSEHPDVVRLRQQLAALEAKREASGSSGQSRLLENPRYIQVRAELNSIESELTALRTSEPELKQKIQDYEERLRRTPQVESEYQALNRRLESLKSTFNDLQRRAVSAQQSEALESTDIAARLAQVVAPVLPRSPSGPPRAAILILGAFLAGTLGLGSMLLAEMTDNTVRDSKDVVRVLDVVPLATIPVIESAASRQAHRRRTLLVRGSFIVLITVLLVYYLKGVF